ncbi:hypothetical protein HYT01_03120 [Candidatus Giovannonibacteria bacterium]|nr:hypothetical protein [Candidatus Giovannonibacteria bacterium]
MTIEFRMLPEIVPLSWKVFLKKYGRYSIALDGFVADGPKMDPSLPAANFNHHEKVSRLETRATCAQVHILIQAGLFKTFRDENGPRAVVYMNDCDEDVSTSATELKYPHLAESVINPRLNKLVDIVDKQDTMSGLYPFPVDMPILQEVAWVFEPYRRFRLAGGLDSRNSGAFESILADVEHRILKFIVGEQRRLTLDIRYKVIFSGTGWAMIEEIGPYGRQGALADGIKAFISVRKRDDGNYTYSFGRVSECIPFPVPNILRACDKKEDRHPHHWGGGSTTGGSPRVGGSKQKPIAVFKIAETETRLYICKSRH